MNKRGFTLIELLIVIAIAVIIAGALIPLFNASKQDAKIAKLLTLVDALKTACEQYHFDTSEYAKEYSDGSTDCSDPIQRTLSCNPGIPGWNGPYINAPLTAQDSPFPGAGNYRSVYLDNTLVNFDLDGMEDTPDIGGNGNEMRLLVPSDIALSVDGIIDKNIPGTGSYSQTGKIKIDAFPPLPSYRIVTIYLYGGEPQ